MRREKYEYPYAYEHFLQFNDSPIFVYQLNTGTFGKMYDLLEDGEMLFRKIEYSNVMCAVDIFEDVDSSNLLLGLHFSSSNYSSASMERFCKLFNDAVHYLDGFSPKQEDHERT